MFYATDGGSSDYFLCGLLVMGRKAGIGFGIIPSSGTIGLVDIKVSVPTKHGIPGICIEDARVFLLPCCTRIA